MAKIIIAGGTGLIGKAVEKRLTAEGHSVFILTRSPKKPNHIAWDPIKKTIENERVVDTECVINLTGESIGEGRWTDKRKAQLLSSRVETTQFLFAVFHREKSLKQYISASGIDAYPLNDPNKTMAEDDAYGTAYLAQLVKKWEEAADLFSRVVPVCKLRISMVLAPHGGALQKMMPLVKWGIASPLGTGQQMMSWIHIDDLANAFFHAFTHQLDGAFNVSGRAVTNTTFMKTLMQVKGKKMWAPSVPAFVMKLVMGEQATLVLDGANVSVDKLRQTGYQPRFDSLQDALLEINK